MATHMLSVEAKGGEALLVLPASRDYEVHSIYVDYQAGAGGGQRQVRVTMEDPVGNVVAITGGESQPAGSRRHYMCFPYAPIARVTAGDDIQFCPWPGGLVTSPGSGIRAKNMNGAATPNDVVRIRVQYDSAMGNKGTTD